MDMHELIALHRARCAPELLPDGAYDVVVREVKFESWGGPLFLSLALEVTNGPCKGRLVRERWRAADNAPHDLFLAS